MYCAWRIPAHLRCTQCSILLHLMDICFLTCICLWQISQIQTFLFKVVGPGLVSTSPAFVSSIASHPAGPHGRHAQKIVNRAPIAVTAPPLVGCVVWSLVVVVVDLPLLCVAVEGSDNPVSLEKPCQASLPPDQQGRHSLGRQPEVQHIA